MTRQSFSSAKLLIASLFCILVISNAVSPLKQTIRMRILEDAHDHAGHNHDEKEVDADDHSHAIELQACTGAQLELTGNAIFTAEDVYNSKQFLVTNVELESCEDIAALKCHPKAKVCTKWGAHDHQNIRLNYDDFTSGQAHFYAMAEDTAHEVSVIVKVHPEGAQTHEANHHHDAHNIHQKHKVEDDSNYHAVEINACEGATLELPENKDAIFDAAVVFNAKKFLVTDVELTSCNDIKTLTCNPSAKFCHVWDAHAQEAVLLEHAHFPKKEAYFYVEPVDHKRESSVNVKVVDAVHDEHGVHAVDDKTAHDPTKHDGHDTAHDENDLEVDGHTHALEIHACTGSTIELHHDATLTVHNVFNAKRYMVSNLEFHTCEEIEAFVCPKQATYCHIWNAANEDESVHLDKSMFADGKAHFYADFIDKTKAVALNLRVVPNEELGDKPSAHGGHEEKEIETDGTTHAMEIHACTGVTLELQGDTILDAQNVFNSKAFLVTDVELTTCEEIEHLKCHEDSQVCHTWKADAHEDVLLHHDNFHNSEAFLYVQALDTKKEMSINLRLTEQGKYHKEEHAGHDIVEALKSHLSGLSFEQLVVRGAMALFVFVGIIACFYRFWLGRFKRAPFSPPSWCPSFCFPTDHSEAAENFIQREARKQDNQELQGGIFRQVEV